jgi:hypothetical protein
MNRSVLSSLRQQKNDLLATEILSFETRLSAMEVRKYITLLKLPFERLDHHRADLPIFIPANTTRNFSFLNPNVRDDRNRSVILPQITERRPIVIILRAYTRRQHKNYEKGFE